MVIEHTSWTYEYVENEVTLPMIREMNRFKEFVAAKVKNG